MDRRPRCVAINENSRRCELVHGHVGRHSATAGAPRPGPDGRFPSTEIWVDESPEVRAGRAFGISVWD